MSINIDNPQKSNQQERCEFKWNGFYRALVLSAKDPRMLGRVKVRIPDLMPENGSDDCGCYNAKGLWSHPANNFLGGRNIQDTMGQRASFEDAWYQGSCLTPPKGSWVFIFFENGDPNHPYFFASGEFGQRKVLPECQEGSEYWKKWVLFKSKAGRCIVISDDDGTDARIEITGKKRMIGKPPDGDTDSVYLIDDNMTTIMIDERPGEERLFIKDYRGNYLAFHTDDSVGQDQFHVFFKNDIHIESLKNIYMKSGESFHIDVGTNFNLTAGTTIDTLAGDKHSETANEFSRFSKTKDNRTAFTEINDTALTTMTQSCAGSMKIAASNMIITGATNCMLKCLSTIVLDTPTSIVTNSSPIINIPMIYSSMSKSADIAIPSADRGMTCMRHPSVEPVVPSEDIEPPCAACAPHEVTQCYNASVGCGASDKQEPSQELKDNKRSSTCGGCPSRPLPDDDDSQRSFDSEELVDRQGGVGHMYALCLKREYWEKIPALVDKSYGTFTGFYAFKNYSSDMIDYEFIDTDVVPVYDDYEDPTDWMINLEDQWWKNLEEFCNLAATNQITIIPSLFDFSDSPNDPYINHLPNPYQFDNWSDSKQGEYLRNLVNIIKSSGVDYILNLGVRDYGTDLPTSGYLRNLIMFLVNELGISSNKLSLSDSLYDKNPYCNFKTVYDSDIPGNDILNIEEMVDGELGGTATVDGYKSYIRGCGITGIPCMNTWKMSEFKDTIPEGMDITHVNVMNYIFAPNQRCAMREVIGNTTNSGFIDFT